MNFRWNFALICGSDIVRNHLGIKIASLMKYNVIANTQLMVLLKAKIEVAITVLVCISSLLEECWSARH